MQQRIYYGRIILLRSFLSKEKGETLLNISSNNPDHKYNLSNKSKACCLIKPFSDASEIVTIV